MGPRARWAMGTAAVWAVLLAGNRSLRRVRGPSMVPTLAPGDLVLTVPRGDRVPRRGQVVLVRARDGVHVKRVVGLPGERVAVQRGRARVDGQRLDEPYAVGTGPAATFDVPAGHVAVLGDGRGASTDSRSYGPVPLDDVLRRVVLAVGPPPRLLRR